MPLETGVPRTTFFSKAAEQDEKFASTQVCTQQEQCRSVLYYRSKL